MFSFAASECSLEDFMQFFCGCRQVPPSGFEAQPTIRFLAEGRLPTVSTCELVLFLPALENEVEFAEAMVFGILNSPTIDKR
jgi:hypothetical protein